MRNVRDRIDRAIYRWLEALAGVRIGSVSGSIQRYAELGCRPQASRRNRDPAWVGLRAAESPLRGCNKRELDALALRYSGPVVASSRLLDGHIVETTRRTLTPYAAIGAVLGCSSDAARGLIARARAKVGKALKGRGR